MDRDIKKERKGLRQLFAEAPAVLPSVYDCISARAAELCGYEGIYLDPSDLAVSQHGLGASFGLSPEELVWMTSRIAASTFLPVLAGMKDGFFREAEAVRWLAGRLLHQGADGLLLWRDSKDPLFLEKVAAVSEITGTNHILAVVLKESEGETEEYRKLKSAGADTVIGSSYGEMTIVHPFLEGALYGMKDFAKQNAANQNTVYHDEHDFDGYLPGKDHHCLFAYNRYWMPLERRFQDLSGLREERKDKHEA